MANRLAQRWSLARDGLCPSLSTHHPFDPGFHLQAFLFHVPYLIWYAFAINSGVNIKSVLGAAKELSNLKEVTQNKDQMLGDLTEQLDTYLRWMP
jgi:hypothetical protein